MSRRRTKSSGDPMSVRTASFIAPCFAASVLEDDVSCCLGVSEDTFSSSLLLATTPKTSPTEFDHHLSKALSLTV